MVMRGNRWTEIVEQMKSSINCGNLQPGDRLPSETDFATEWGISRMTAHRVMSELQEAGLVERRPRAGTIVSPRRRLKTVAVLMHDTRLNPQASYLQGISEHLGSDYDLLLCDTGGSPEQEAEIFRTVAERADGLIIFPTAAPQNTSLLAKLVGSMPVVCIDRVPDGLAVHAVVTDEFESSLEGLRLLTARGHKRIAHFTNESFHISSVRGRLDAYLATLAEVGELGTKWLRTFSAQGLSFREFGENIHLGLEAMMHSEPPTALFCVHDDYMASALVSCVRLNIKLEILSVNDTPTLPIFGFDEVHRIVPQTLELGRLAARQLITLAKEPKLAPDTIRLRSQVVPARM